MQLCTTPDEIGTKSIMRREQLRQHILSIEGALDGLRTCLPDFTIPIHHENDRREDVSVSLVLAGSVGIKLDFPGLREKIAHALLAAFNWVDDHDVDTVKVCSSALPAIGRVPAHFMVFLEEAVRPPGAKVVSPHNFWWPWCAECCPPHQQDCQFWGARIRRIG